MEYLSKPAIANAVSEQYGVNISSMTARRYIDSFKEFFTDKQQKHGNDTFSPDAVKIIHDIYSMYNNMKYSKEIIRQKLSEKYDAGDMPELPPTIIPITNNMLMEKLSDIERRLLELSDTLLNRTPTTAHNTTENLELDTTPDNITPTMTDNIKDMFDGNGVTLVNDNITPDTTDNTETAASEQEITPDTTQDSETIPDGIELDLTNNTTQDNETPDDIDESTAVEELELDLTDNITPDNIENDTAAAELELDLSNTTTDNTADDKESVTHDITPEQMPDYHGVKLTVQQRDDILFAVEKMIPGKRVNMKRAAALNDAGVLTSTGKTWSSKLFTDNLRLAKKRASKKK